MAVKTFFLEGASKDFPEEVSNVLSDSYAIASSSFYYKLKSFFFGLQFASKHFFSEQE